jgi:diguanylate cyclase (GGDEF)-like protein
MIINKSLSAITKYTFLLMTFWSLIIVFFAYWNNSRLAKTTEDIAINQAKGYFKRDSAIRFWATNHGGVYVKINDKTPPNPNLAHVQDRDIVTPSGQHLTLMNPAYMIRQLNEQFEEFYGVASHITSLKLLRKENKPDEWEREALASFEDGKDELLEFTEINNEPFLRLMEPLITEKGCLKCHSHQGYKVGDIRGGVAVALPLKSLIEEQKHTQKNQNLTLFTLWVLGILLLLATRKKLFRMESELLNYLSKLKSLNSKLEHMSTIDELTQIPNRRMCTERLTEEYMRSRRDKTPLSIIMCDIDHFKLMNDTYGHKAGDKCLTKVAQSIQKSLLRTIDFCARYGGEEFVVILSNTDKKGAIIVAEEIRNKIADLKIPNKHSTPVPTITLSLGVSTSKGNLIKTAEALLDFADKALYSAKENGRNQVIHYDS